MKTSVIIVAAISFVAGITPLRGQMTGVRDDASEADRGYVSAMKTDLRALATAEEAYFIDHSGYYYGPVTSARPLYGFSPSHGVTIDVAAAFEGAMWIAVASHPRTQTTCTYKLPEPIACTSPAPTPSATPSLVPSRSPAPPTTPVGAAGVSPDSKSATAGEIAIGDSKPVGIRPRQSHKWEFEIKYPRTNCLAMGQIETLSGGDKNVSVVIVRDSLYNDWAQNRPVRTEYESGERTVVAFDVGINDVGRYMLVVSNSSTTASKVVQLQHVTVTCAE